MVKKCSVCGAPNSGSKCDYCGKRIGKGGEDHLTEALDLDETLEATQQQYDHATTRASNSASDVLSKRKNYILISVYIAGMFILPMLIAPVVVLIRGYTVEHFHGDGFFSVLTLTNFVAYATLCCAVLLLTHKVFKQDFQKIDSLGNFFKQMGLGLLFTFGAAMLGNSIVFWLGTEETALNQELVESALEAMPILMIIAIVVFAPIVEEVIFRLVLMNLFNWTPIYNLIFSSLLFGLIHVLSGGLIHIVPYFLMGLVFGYFYLKHNNIWHITILHVLHNGLTVILVFGAQRMQYVLDLY